MTCNFICRLLVTGQTSALAVHCWLLDSLQDTIGAQHEL